MARSSLSVVFVTQFSPAAVGHGGHHRTYQLDHDLRHAVGDGRVSILSLEEEWAREKPRGAPWTTHPRRSRVYLAVRRRVESFIDALWNARENPTALLGYRGFSTRPFKRRALMARYEASLANSRGPVLCVLQHPG